MEINTDAELDATKCVEVAGMELVGSTNLRSGAAGGWSTAAMGGTSMGGGARLGRGCAAQAGAVPTSGSGGGTGEWLIAIASGGVQHRAARATWASG